jgi:hypothetical protein
MKLSRLPAPLLAVFLLTGCVEETPRYSLSAGEVGVFRSANAGRPIALASIKGMDERQVLETFGKPDLDRRDAATRTLRYHSDGCTLFVYLTNQHAQYADALDPQMRPLPLDACAGSVATQKRGLS